MKFSTKVIPLSLVLDVAIVGCASAQSSEHFIGSNREQVISLALSNSTATFELYETSANGNIKSSKIDFRVTGFGPQIVLHGRGDCTERIERGNDSVKVHVPTARGAVETIYLARSTDQGLGDALSGLRGTASEQLSEQLRGMRPTLFLTDCGLQRQRR